MPYFTTRKVFLVAPTAPDLQEERKLASFLQFLERSGVGRVIERHVRNQTAKGGRPSVNYYNLFAAVLFVFAFGTPTLRGIESSIAHDDRFMFLMEFAKADYTTIAKFINAVIVPNELEIFGLLCRQLAAEMGLSLEDAFVDGTKMEANANKYKFVWKPIAFHRRLTATASEIIERLRLIDGFARPELIASSAIAKAVTALSARPESPEKAAAMKALSSMLSKCAEYEWKESVCGESRKSFYKTDRDATAMALKADYYSGLGSNMHAAYNVQIMVSEGIVLSYYVSSSRADVADFVPTVERFHAAMGLYPKNVCADAGYGSLANYRFLKEKGIGNYVKHQSWEGNASGRAPDCYVMLSPGRIRCLWGKEGGRAHVPGRKPRSAGAVFYRIEGCPFFAYCRRFQANPDPKEKVFEVVEELQALKGEAVANLLSPKGIEIRANRSIQVEGAFGFIKQNQGYVRARRRGMGAVSAEIMLTVMGINIKRLFSFYEKGRKPTWWRAPPGLPPQTFPKPSAKKLSKRGKKVSERMKKGTETPE